MHTFWCGTAFMGDMIFGLQISAALPPPSLNENEFEQSSKRRTRSCGLLSVSAGSKCIFLCWRGVTSIGSSSPKYIDSIRELSSYRAMCGEPGWTNSLTDTHWIAFNLLFFNTDVFWICNERLFSRRCSSNWPSPRQGGRGTLTAYLPPVNFNLHGEITSHLHDYNILQVKIASKESMDYISTYWREWD